MHARRLLAVMAEAVLLSGLLGGCQIAVGTVVSPATANAPDPAAPAASPSPLTPRAPLPPTWTPAPFTATIALTPSRTPTATHDLPKTLVAQTTVAAGLHCQRHPEAWQVFSGPAAAYAGWCRVVGASDTLYEYRLLSPDGWVVNTFGELTPNLAFSTGKKNVDIRLYEAYAYGTYNYSGTLEDAPEQATVCDENERCYGFINPHEAIVRQQVKEIGLRSILILDSEIDNPAGTLSVRRYYSILPFTSYNRQSQRLFILELVWLENALSEQEHAALLDQLEEMILSVEPR